MASRLAVLFVFQFRTPFSGDGCACPVVCCRPGPFAITLWTMCQSGVAWSAHCSQVPREAVVVPHDGSREAPIATVDHGGQVRMRWFSGFSRPTPCSMPTFRPSVPTERTLARVCREAGATVRRNAKLRDMNINVSATDERAIEVLASGLGLNHGAQLAVDITVRSAFTACGRARPNTSTVDGAVLTEARHDKEAKYAELCQGGRCQLVVVGIETGGRWSPEALSVEQLAASRAREAPSALRFSTFLARGSGGVGCCPFRAAVQSPGNLCLQRTTSWKALTATCLSWLFCCQLSSVVRF